MPHSIGKCLAAALLCAGALAGTAPAQDREYIAAFERAQRARPAELSAEARIAPPDEPGMPLRIHGQVFQADGRTPAAGAIVFAYHTDENGLYDKPGAGPHAWRLRGWARADAHGRFEFVTIRPGAYPGSRVPAHVHFSVVQPDSTRYHAGELRFDDDPFVTDGDRAASRARGAFGEVRPVERRDGIMHASISLRLDTRQRF